MATGGHRLGDLAEVAGAELRGDPDRLVDGVRPLSSAGPYDLSFLTSAKYRSAAAVSAAGALLTSPDLAAHGELKAALLVVAEPGQALIRVLTRMYPPSAPDPGIHRTAVVHKSATVDPSASVGPYVDVGEGSFLGPGVVLHSHVVVGRRCVLHGGVVLHPHVVLYDQTEVGPYCVIHAGAVLGADGFGYATEGGGRLKMPQVGRVVLDAEVEVGANSTIDRAMLEATHIGRGTKIDNLVQVGHNVVMGENCVLCGQVGISGSVELGRGVVMGGQAGVADHLTLGDGVHVAGKSAVFRSFPAGEVVSGIPAQPIAAWRRQVGLLTRLADLRRRLLRLEGRRGRPQAEEEGS